MSGISFFKSKVPDKIATKPQILTITNKPMMPYIISFLPLALFFLVIPRSDIIDYPDKQDDDGDGDKQGSQLVYNSFSQIERSLMLSTAPAAKGIAIKPNGISFLIIFIN